MNINDLPKECEKPIDDIVIVRPEDIRDNCTYPSPGGGIRCRVSHSCAWCGRSYYAWYMVMTRNVVCSPKCKYEMRVSDLMDIGSIHTTEQGKS